MIDYVSFQTFNDRGFLVDFLYYLTCNTKYLNPAIYSLEQITSVAEPYNHKGTMKKRLALFLLLTLRGVNKKELFFFFKFFNVHFTDNLFLSHHEIFVFLMKDSRLKILYYIPLS